MYRVTHAHECTVAEIYHKDVMNLPQDAISQDGKERLLQGVGTLKFTD